MDTDIPGIPQAFTDMKPGTFFAFRLASFTTLALKVVPRDPNDPRFAAVFHHGDPKRELLPFLLRKDKAKVPDIGHVLPAQLICNWASFENLRAGVTNAEPGQIIVTAGQKLIGVRDTDDDRMMVDLETGECLYEIKQMASVFSAWKLSLGQGDGMQPLYEFKSQKND